MEDNGLSNSIPNPKWLPTQEGGKSINLQPLCTGIELMGPANGIH